MTEEVTYTGNSIGAQDDSIEKANVVVPLRECFGYSLTEAGFNAMNYLMSTYLTIYLTDIIGVGRRRR